MSLESAVANLVAKSTALTAEMNITLAYVEGRRDAALAQEAPAVTAKVAAEASATAAATSAAGTPANVTTAKDDYAAQQTAKGLAAVRTEANTALLDKLGRFDPARNPMRGQLPNFVMDFVRRECHKNVGGQLSPYTLASQLVVSRTSTGTSYGPSGKVVTSAANEPRYQHNPLTGECLGVLSEEARTNAVPYSDQPVFGSWGTAALRREINSALAPDGTMTALRLVADATTGNHYLQNSLTGLADNTVITVSVFCKADGYNYLSIQGKTKAATYPNAVYDLVTGAYVVGNGTGNATAGIQPLPDGWFRVWLTWDIGTGAADPMFFMAPRGSYTSGVSFTGDDRSGGLVWGPQLEVGAFPSTYIPCLTTWTGRASSASYVNASGLVAVAANGVARSNAYEYDRGGILQPVGLLAEQASTNLHISSQDLSSGWTMLGVTRANGFTSPAGDTTATKLVEDATNAEHRVGAAAGNLVSILAGSICTGSVYAKAGERRYVYLILSSVATWGTDTTDSAKFDLQTGTVVWASGVLRASIKPAGNGWYRLSVTGTALSDTTATGVSIGLCSNGNAVGGRDAYLGDGVSGVYAWGMQFEQSPVMTSYIATAGAQVTRAADTVTSAQTTRAAESLDAVGILSWLNIGEGTLMVDATVDNAAGVSLEALSRTALALYKAGSTDMIRVGYSNLLAYEIVTGGASQASSSVGASAVGRHKYALTYKKDSVQPFHNSVAGTEDTNAKIPSVVDTLAIGRSSGIGRLCGVVRTVTCYPRAMVSADAQALTTID